VLLPRNAAWLEAELLAYPHGSHDDQADACSSIGLERRSGFRWLTTFDALNRARDLKRYAGSPLKWNKG